MKEYEWNCLPLSGGLNGRYIGLLLLATSGIFLSPSTGSFSGVTTLLFDSFALRGAVTGGPTKLDDLGGLGIAARVFFASSARLLGFEAGSSCFRSDISFSGDAFYRLTLSGERE